MPGNYYANPATECIELVSCLCECGTECCNLCECGKVLCGWIKIAAAAVCILGVLAAGFAGLYYGVSPAVCFGTAGGAVGLVGTGVCCYCCCMRNRNEHSSNNVQPSYVTAVIHTPDAAVEFESTEERCGERLSASLLFASKSNNQMTNNNFKIKLHDDCVSVNKPGPMSRYCWVALHIRRKIT